ncbi:MAG: peptidylprolyl isomerase [Gemmatimonadota bacterium]
MTRPRAACPAPRGARPRAITGGVAVPLVLGIVASLTLGGTSAAQRPAGPTARALATRVPDARWRRPWAAVLRMADRRDYDSATVAVALASDAPSSLAVVTLHALGQLRAHEGQAWLLASLRGSSPDRAAAAAFALGTRGRAGLPDSTWEVLESVAIGGGPAAAAAVRALTTQPGRVGRVVRRILADSAAPRATQIEALIISGLVRDAPAPPAALIASADTGVARAAVYAAARLRRPALARALLARAAQPSPSSVLALAARGLGRAATGDSLADSARRALASLVQHRDPVVRTEAVLALGTHGAAAADPLAAALRDPHALVRQAAVVGFLAARRGDTGAVRLAWQADTALHLREAVLQALGAWGGDPMPAEAKAWASDADWRRRALHAQWVLPSRVRYALGDAAAFDAPLADADARVRRAALEGMLLAGAPPFPPRGTPERLRRATDDASPLVRAAAWGAMARGVPDTADVPRAIAAWAVAVRDTVDEDARTGIARFLGVAYGRATAPAPGDTMPRRDWQEAWTEAIRALPPPTDPAEAARLMGLFGSLRPAWRVADPEMDVPATDRPIAWYDSVVRAIVWPALGGRPPRARLATSRGQLLITLDGATAPLTVENLSRLARRRYFDGLAFHRVVPAFVAQGGDPTGTGSGGPGYAIRDELSPTPYERGTLGMALSGPDTGGSQWFLTLTWQPHLTGGYTVFGRVTAGWEVLDALRQHDLIVRLSVVP